MSKIFTVKLEC